MKYTLPGSSMTLSEESNITLEYSRFGPDVEKARNHWVTARSYVFAAHYARTQAAIAFDNGNIDGARKILKSSMIDLSMAPVESPLLQKEIEVTRQYEKSINRTMSKKERAKTQKRIKYKSYTIEGC
jgi:hypothetical protein